MLTKVSFSALNICIISNLKSFSSKSNIWTFAGQLLLLAFPHTPHMGLNISVSSKPLLCVCIGAYLPSIFQKTLYSSTWGSLPWVIRELLCLSQIFPEYVHNPPHTCRLLESWKYFLLFQSLLWTSYFSVSFVRFLVSLLLPLTCSISWGIICHVKQFSLIWGNKFHREMAVLTSGDMRWIK